MILPTWEMDEKQNLTVRSEPLEAEQRREIAKRIRQKYAPVYPVVLFPCDQCKVPKVETPGRNCVTCAELIWTRQKQLADKLAARNMVIRFAVVSVVAGLLVWLASWLLAKS